MRLYYRSYFDVHYNSFAFVDDYHQAWTDLFFLNICPGRSSSFGSTTIAESCLLSGLSDNGTFMVVGDLIRKVEALDFSHPLNPAFLYEYETLSKAHRLVTGFLIRAQGTLADSFSGAMLQVLLVWLLCGLALIFLWGIPVTRSFLLEINEIKNIISILPVSLARELPNARRYFHKILKQDACC
jgi:hypothetical protein